MEGTHEVGRRPFKPQTVAKAYRTRRDYYFKTRNTVREYRLRIKRWKAEQKYPADTLSFCRQL